MTVDRRDAMKPRRDLFVGLDDLTPILSGAIAPYINFDNAATTPALKSVVEAISH